MHLAARRLFTNEQSLQQGVFTIQHIYKGFYSKEGTINNHTQGNAECVSVCETEHYISYKQETGQWSFFSVLRYFLMSYT